MVQPLPTNDPPSARKHASNDAEKLKQRGNTAFKSFKLDEAVELYSSAMALAPNTPVYASNRSAARFEAGKYAECLADIQAALAMQPEPALATKLALRAVRSALWLDQYSEAQAWLQHAALQGADAQAQVQLLQEQLQACKAFHAQCSSGDLRGLAGGGDTDAPLLLRDSIIGAKQAMFPSGHDKPRDLLDGAVPRSAQRCHAALAVNQRLVSSCVRAHSQSYSTLPRRRLPVHISAAALARICARRVFHQQRNLRHAAGCCASRCLNVSPRQRS